MERSNLQLELACREMRNALLTYVGPEVTSEKAKDVVACLDRLLTVAALEARHAAELNSEFTKRFEEAVAQATEHVRVSGIAAGKIDAEPLDPLVLPDNAASRKFHEARQAGQILVRQLAQYDRPLSGAIIEAQNAIAAVENDFLNRIAELKAAIAEPAAEIEGNSGASVSRYMLETYLRRQFNDDPAIQVSNIRPIPGGRSKETIIFAVESGGRLPSEILLRMDRPQGILNTRASDEFRIVSAVHRADVMPLARPLFSESDATHLGAPFLMVEKLPGSKQGEFMPEILSPPAAIGRMIGEQVAGAMARFHAFDFLSELGAQMRRPEDARAVLQESIEFEYTRFRQVVGTPNVAIERAYSWLMDHLDDGITEECLTHGDIGLHNLLIDGNRVTAIVDWELARIGSPARDIGMLRHAIEHLMPWPDFIRLYRDAGGPAAACAPRAVNFYAISIFMSAAIISRIGGHLFITNQKRDIVTANSGYDFHYRTSKQLINALQIAEGF